MKTLEQLEIEYLEWLNNLTPEKKKESAPAIDFIAITNAKLYEILMELSGIRAKRPRP